MGSTRGIANEARVSRRKALQVVLGAAGALASGRALGQSHPPAGRGAAADWSRLQSKLKGRVISRQDPEYEKDRQSELRNVLKPARFPDAIAYVASEQDVREAVQFAAKQKLRVALRGGGHSWCGSPLRQGGLLLDLSQLNAFAVDAAKRQATAQPVVRGRDALAALEPQRLAFPLGHCRTVPLSGYLLNGGIGWNSGAWGPACMSVTGIEAVNAAGESILADANQNPELYWAARGAGPGFFAAVTRYHLQLYPMPAAIRTSTVTYRLEDVGRVADWLPELVKSLPPQVEVDCFIVSAPPEPSQGPPPKLFIVAAAAFADTEADASKWLAPLADGPQLPSRRQELVQPASFSSLYDMPDRLFPEGRRYAGDAFTFNVSPKEVLTRLHDQAVKAPSPESFMLLALPSPRPANAPPLPDMAFSMPGSVFAGVYGIWQDPSQDATNQQWVRQAGKLLDPITVGHYIGETDLTADTNRARQCFAPPNWQRLQQIRKKYDPDGLFFDYLGPT